MFARLNIEKCSWQLTLPSSEQTKNTSFDMPIEITREYLISQRLSVTFADRFWDKVNKNSGFVPSHCPHLGQCWAWKASKFRAGYGQISRGSTYRSSMLASRASWIINCGPIPDGLDVLHKCDNPECVNPDHLFTGTHRENMDDMISKGRNFIPTQPHGEDHPSSKLTQSQVDQIRKLDLS